MQKCLGSGHTFDKRQLKYSGSGHHSDNVIFILQKILGSGHACIWPGNTDVWCFNNCFNNPPFCPPSHCQCDAWETLTPPPPSPAPPLPQCIGLWQKCSSFTDSCCAGTVCVYDSFWWSSACLKSLSVFSILRGHMRWPNEATNFMAKRSNQFYGATHQATNFTYGATH